MLTTDALAQARQESGSELMLLGGVYFVTFLCANLTIAMCGPGCCFVFYSVFAAISGLLMLRRSVSTRRVCLCVLLLSLYGMWYEKETRDSWQVKMMKRQVERIQGMIPPPPAK